MISIKRSFDTLLNKQYPCPKGILGRLTGELMVRQHEKETAWTVSIADVQLHDHVLEIGFGAGKAIELLAEKAIQGMVHGVDLSAVMVKRARERNADAIRAGRVLLQQGDAIQLPFEERYFEKVVSIHTFYFWTDPQKILTEIFRVLKPGGKLVFTLATGKIGEAEEDGYQTIIEEQVLPPMRSIGFTDVSSR